MNEYVAFQDVWHKVVWRGPDAVMLVLVLDKGEVSEGCRQNVVGFIFI